MGNTELSGDDRPKQLTYEAGGELDALIAEKIMERRIYHGPLATDSVQLIVEGSWLNTKEYGVQPTTELCPAYSVDIAAAWNVVEKLRTSGRTVYIHANVTGPSYSVEAFVVGVLEKGATAVGETAPLAICRAALKLSEEMAKPLWGRMGEGSG